MAGGLVVKSYLALDGGAPGPIAEYDAGNEYVELGGLLIELRDGIVEVRNIGGGGLAISPVAANAVRVTRA